MHTEINFCQLFVPHLHIQLNDNSLFSQVKIIRKTIFVWNYDKNTNLNFFSARNVI